MNRFETAREVYFIAHLSFWGCGEMCSTLHSLSLPHELKHQSTSILPTRLLKYKYTWIFIVNGFAAALLRLRAHRPHLCDFGTQRKPMSTRELQLMRATL